MNLRFVEDFYWVASLKSSSRAADKLFLNQSAMSSRIATLEEEQGVLLLDRRDNQFKLIAAGGVLHDRFDSSRRCFSDIGQWVSSACHGT